MKHPVSPLRTIADIFRSYAVFDADGRHINGCDKQSNHRYGDAYERIISDLGVGMVGGRRKVSLMMEVGVADGSSLCAWREVFPNAHIVGMDIHHSDKAHGERIEFHIGDQRSRDDCVKVARGRLFDIIVEDATHKLEDSLRTLLFLWPYITPGGLYIIEEFEDVGSLGHHIKDLWPNAEVVNTIGPFGGHEPLVVFRKPVS